MTKTAKPAAGRAVPAGTRGFIARLLAPLPDADLADPGLARLEKKAAAAARKKAADRWKAGMCLVESAEAFRRAIGLLAAADVWIGKSAVRPGLREDEDKAARALAVEINRQFEMPAPNKGALAWKRAQVNIGSFYIRGDEMNRRKAALARDEARLGLA